MSQLKSRKRKKNNILSNEWKSFLKDVSICSLSAFGGPEAHYGVFNDQLVNKKGYISDKDLAELIGLTTILPGPSSTQTIIAIAYRVGGPLLAFLTSLIWIMPSTILMSILSLLTYYFTAATGHKSMLSYLGTMALAFIIVSAYRISFNVVRDKLTLGLLVFGAITTYTIKSPWIFPIILIIGGLVSIIESKERKIWNKVRVRPNWLYLFLFILMTVGSIFLSLKSNNLIIDLFESFYRYGYLVVGGGQALVSMMHNELVVNHNYINNQDFLTGFGLVQGIPGPMFSFAAYVGGLVASDQGVFLHIVTALLSGIAIFLPGVLLIYFVYPIWQDLRQIKGIKIFLKGLTAVSAGMIVATGLLFFNKQTMDLSNSIILFSTIAALLWKKIPVPIIVIVVLLAGYII
ncbi:MULTISPECIES: chromate efflux transporter [unclassified Gemella]|uniref:chromate efflux transporter n=1 Tax=unclassified Gemella TaxID=2624949 RepID=UPI0015D03859|nr:MULTISPECIES: chromate efflux transporter [unclassified Gemella]MBF0710641.1 chromate efflux transporter [Gemella sp. GL1.1]NYS27985.1 chromate efflux transporter [Gemella sp. GL1]